MKGKPMYQHSTERGETPRSPRSERPRFLPLLPILALPFMLAACGRNGSEISISSEHVLRIADRADFEQRVLSAEGLFLVDFYADWCPPCRMLGPVLDQLSHEMSGTVTIAKINVDRNRELSKQYEVRGIPHLLLMESGQVLDSRTGFMEKTALKAWIDEVKPERRRPTMHEVTASSDEALQRLLEGNRRYTTARPDHPRQEQQRREHTLQSQQPFAIILSCSDSRVPPEIIFDQGVGDLFVIRVAGNVVDEVVLGSVEYAADHLAVPLVMVLAHSGCGAVTAVLGGGAMDGSLPAIVERIQPAVDQTRGAPGDRLANAIQANARKAAADLAASPIIRPLIEQGRVRIVTANYDLASGRVELL